jgi:hypothetical protein
VDWKPLRYTAVPWLLTEVDLRAMGPAEFCFESGDAIAMQLLIPNPFGNDTTVMLSIATEDWRNKEVKLAIGERVSEWHPIETPVKRTTKKFYPPPDDNGANEPDED